MIRRLLATWRLRRLQRTFPDMAAYQRLSRALTR